MSKKILSIALAVVMLFSVLAFSASAANTTVTTTFPGANQMGFRVVSDAYVGMPAGEEVTVKVYWVYPTGTDFDSWLMSVGNVVLAYNNEAYTYNTENDGSTSLGYDGRTWGAAYADYMKPAGNVNTGATITNTVISGLTAADKAYGWNDMVLTQMVVDTSVTTNAKGFPVDADCEVFSLSFTTVREITAADVIGIPASTITKQTLLAYSTGSKQVKFTAANIINNEPAVPAVVAGGDTLTAKMRPGEVDGTVDLGITGTVLTASFDPGKTPVYNGAGEEAGATAANLAAVGVQVRVDGVVAAAEGTCIYDTGDGFNYRPAITGIDADGLNSLIEVRNYITDVNGNTYFSNWMLIDAADVHDAAVGNGMTGIA
ncbi:MAG: hypothetical protein IKT55_00810 [Clostridia bacterium]|nr:hypothetical protein [Clostridia bacterium]